MRLHPQSSKVSGLSTEFKGRSPFTFFRVLNNLIPFFIFSKKFPRFEVLKYYINANPLIIFFLTPPALSGVPVVQFHVRQTYCLSFLAFKRVDCRSAIKTHFLSPSPQLPQVLVAVGAAGAWSKPIKTIRCHQS